MKLCFCFTALLTIRICLMQVQSFSDDLPIISPRLYEYMKEIIVNPYLQSYTSTWVKRKLLYFPRTKIKHNAKWYIISDKYIQQNTKHKVSRKISNFNKYLRPFQNCLTHISRDWNQQLDYGPFDYPVVLTDKQYLLHESSFKSISWEKISKSLKSVDEEFVGPTTNDLEIIINLDALRRTGVKLLEKTNNQSYCSSSKFHVPIERIGKGNPKVLKDRAYCAAINFRSFVSNNKPWNCEVHIDAFPNLDLWFFKDDWFFNEISEHLPLFWSSHGLDVSLKSQNTLPTQNIYSIIILEETDYQAFKENTYLHMYTLVHSSAGKFSFSLTLKTVLAFVVETQRLQSTLYSFDEQIQEVLQLHLINDCETQLEMIPVNFSTSEKISWHAKNQVLCKGGQQNHLLHRGWISTYTRDLTDAPYLIPDLISENLYDVLKKVQENTPINKIYLQGIAVIWQHIFPNKSVVKRLERAQISCIQMTVHYHRFSKNEGEISEDNDVTNTYYPLVLELPIETLQFVSCGKPIFSNFKFSELVSVFDQWIWIFCGAMVLLLPFAYSLLSIECSRSQIPQIPKIWWRSALILSPIKAFLEQGDIFPANYLTKHKIRFVIATTLLPCLVLSNAYKNENVYNLIAPHKPVPYDKLSQLLEHSFQIYSRATLKSYKKACLDESVPGIFLGPSNIYCPPNNVTPHQITIGNRTSDMNSMTDGTEFSFSLTIESIVSKFLSKSNTSNFTAKPTLVLWRKVLFENTSLIPNLNLLKYSNMIRQEGWRRNEKNGVVRPTFEGNQIKNGLEILLNCNGTALVTTEVEANEIASHLKQAERTNVHTGKDPLLERNVGYYFRGSLPDASSILKLGGMKQSGISEWWQRYVSKYLTKIKKVRKNIRGNMSLHNGMKDKERNKVFGGGPSMFGNILIIFILWICGNVVGGLALLMERHGFILSILGVCYQHIIACAIKIRIVTVVKSRNAYGV